jgi:hypothetical protein
MATINIKPDRGLLLSTELELQLPFELNSRKQRQLRCRGINLGGKGKKCGNLIRQKVALEVIEVISSISSRAKNGDEVEDLVRKLSSLVLCRRRHQNQLETQYEDWSVKIEDWKLRNCLRIETAEVRSL